MCQEFFDDDEIEMLGDFTPDDTELLPDSNDSQKQNIGYSGGHLVHKYGDMISDNEYEPDIYLYNYWMNFIR